MKTLLFSAVAMAALTLSASASPSAAPVPTISVKPATPVPTAPAKPAAAPKQAIPPHPCGTTTALMCIQYQPDEPTLLPLIPGTTSRVEFAVNEFIASVDASNQDVLDGGDDVPAAEANKTTTDPSVPSCDLNMCRHIIGRFLYLQALRPLKAQTLFVTTHYCASGFPAGVDMAQAILACPDQSYTLVLIPGTVPMYALRYEYPHREAAQKAAWARAAYERRLADERDRREHAPHPVATPTVTAHTKYIFVGKDPASIAPDNTWDDGRTTFMFYKGNREPAVPTRYLDQKHETTDVAYAAEPSPAGTTLRIAGTRKKWCLRRGDTVGCIYNANSDPIGATAQTIAEGPLQ